MYSIGLTEVDFAILGEGNQDFITKSLGKYKIIPRIILENSETNDYVILLENLHNQDNLAEKISEFLSSKKLDGVMLEIWTQGLYLFRSSKEKFYLRSRQVAMLKRICKNIKAKGFMCMMTIPGIRNFENPEFTTNEFVALSNEVDFFALVSYDYSPVQPGPNSPESWIREMQKSLLGSLSNFYGEAKLKKLNSQLMIGIPFYGYEYTYSGGPRYDIRAVVADEFVGSLNKHIMKIE